MYWEAKQSTCSRREDIFRLRIALACLDIERPTNGEEELSSLALNLLDLLHRINKHSLQAAPRFRQCLAEAENFPVQDL